ncbi:MAG TPA: ATP-binding protein [Bryobacteraceae bacterium]|nr:ATP-binding protein [Bryobacteraceae bacterium]
MSRSGDENSRRSKPGAAEFCVPFSSGPAQTYSASRRGERSSERAVLPGFFVASMQLQAAGQFPADRSVMKPRFGNFVQVMDRVLERVGLDVQGLRLPNQKGASLGDAFAAVPSQLGFSSTAAFRVVVYGWKRELKAALCDEVFRIGHEAIMNAFRHSNAQEIVTEIEYRAAELRIVIRDNGCGIKSEDLKWGRNGYWGLQGMRERAERMGARLRLMSKVASGTEVELCVPGEIAFEQPTVRNAC